MEKIKLKICIGTTCFVMGASKFQEFETMIPGKLRNFVDIQYQTCLDLCKNNEYTKSPYVIVNEEIISEANIEKIIKAIERNYKNLNRM